MNDEAAAGAGGRVSSLASATSGGDDTASVRLRDVHMAYGSRVVLRGLSCSFPAGAISVVLGGSGSGKSTVLKLIGGLIAASSGSIEVAGRDVRGLSESALYGVRRSLGMMFQNGALLDSKAYNR